MTDKIAIITQYEENEYLYNALKEVCAEVYAFKSGEEYSENYFAVIHSVAERVDANDVQTVIFCHDIFFGPFVPLHEIFARMECGYEAWGLERRDRNTDIKGKKHEAFIKPYFFVVSARVLRGSRVKEKLESCNYVVDKEFIASLERWGYNIGVYADKSGLSTADMNEDRGVIRPYDMITGCGLPVLSKDVFSYDRIKKLEFDYGDQIQKTIEYIDCTDYDISNIYKYLLNHYSPVQIRSFLNLDYIISNGSETCLNEAVYKQTVIAMHLYYKDLFDTDVQYIKNIPEKIHIVISVKDLQCKEILLEKLSFRKNIEIFPASGTGRDWGAFLLDIRHFIEDYEYICFVHDKKSTGGKGYPIVGTAFMEMTWDSLIPGKEYIDKVLGIFEKNRFLGLLSPGIPYHSGYVKLLGNSWTNCYAITLKVANMLGLKKKISKEYGPFALSSMLWFRKEALTHFFVHQFVPGDFPREPMELDGTFNHALERLVIYIAAENGYFSGTVQGENSVRNRLSNYEDMLRILLSDMEKGAGDVNYYTAFSGIFFQKSIKMLNFIYKNQGSRTYIYGAGYNGRIMYDFFKGLDIEIDGFIISKRFEKPDEYCGLKVFYPDEICKDSKVVIGVDDLYRQEVSEELKENNLKNYY